MKATIGARLRASLDKSGGQQRIAFWSGHLCERGTDTALYDYADCAETELGCRSFVLYDLSSPDNFDGCIAKFSARFRDRLIGVQGFDDVDEVLAEHQINFFYAIKIVDDVRILSKRRGVRNLVHAVFFANRPHGDVYARISDCVPRDNKGGTCDEVPVVPHIVRPAELDGPDMRTELGIPANATVFGRHGGYETFDIPFVRKVIDALARTSDIYFVLMNTPPFCDPHPRILHLSKCSDPQRKAAFIRTCDAMLHARMGGESFGLAIAEFSTFNKPVLTSRVHDDGGAARFHLDTLGQCGIYYHDPPSLLKALVSFDRADAKRRDWNAYRQFAPAVVMARFRDVFLSPPAEEAAGAAATPTAARAAPPEAAAPGAAPIAAEPPGRAELMAKLSVLDATLGSLVRLPTEPEQPISLLPVAADDEAEEDRARRTPPQDISDAHVGTVPDAPSALSLRPPWPLRRYACCHRPYVNMRYAPSTSAGIVRAVMHGEIVVACAQRGLWVRLQEPHREGLQRWVLTRHPILGELLRPVDA